MTNGDWIRSMNDRQLGIVIGVIVKHAFAGIPKDLFIESLYAQQATYWLEDECNKEGLLFKKLNESN